MIGPTQPFVKNYRRIVLILDIVVNSHAQLIDGQDIGLQGITHESELSIGVCFASHAHEHFQHNQRYGK